MCRVLLVSRDPGFLDGVRSLLNGRPDLRVVGEASSAVAALALTPEFEPNVAVVDLEVEHLDAREIARGLRSIDARLHVIVVTGSAQVQGLKPGADIAAVLTRRELSVSTIAGIVHAF